MGTHIHVTPQYKFNNNNQIDSDNLLTEELIKEVLDNSVTRIQICLYTKIPAITYEVLNDKILALKPEIELRIYGGQIDPKHLNKLTNVTNISIDYASFSKAPSFESMKNLTSLAIEIDDLADYNFLNTVTETLTSLSISSYATEFDKIDISVIQRFKELKFLYISGHYKNTVSLISNFENIETLVLRKIKTIEDLNFVTNFKKLKKLHIKSLPIKNFETLSQLKQLEFIEFYNIKNLNTLDFINDMDSLDHIFLQSANNITGFPKLKSTSKLRKIELWYMKQMKDFSPLENLHSLKEFVCREMTLNEPNDFLPILKNNHIEKIYIWFLKEKQRQEMNKLFQQYNKVLADINFMY